jgi:hypothetical protein
MINTPLLPIALLLPASLLAISLLSGCSTTKPYLSPDAPLVYVNESLGFDIPGFKYDQTLIPCKIEPYIIESLIASGAEKNLRIEGVRTEQKIYNTVGVPVLAIDITDLVLAGKNKKIGTKSETDLPRIQVKTALIDRKKNSIVEANHSCAVLQLNEFTPSSNILDLGTNKTVCSAARECIDRLSKDVINWLVPLVEN